ncbi:MAG TPA: marine proteobacterial sortase target protein [Pelomicrobium sp.]|nr:marine proteobacterial sortase target protein [Pelomicrobium sp.]
MQKRSAGPRVASLIARDALAAVGLSVLAGLVTSLTLATLIVLLLAMQSAQAAELGPATAPGQVREGSLLLRMQTGELRPAPAVRTDVTMKVSGLVARVRVAQAFTNPTDEWLDGVYVFPLPESAAVDRLNLRVGSREIEGQIQERGEARRTYDQARAQGRKASLAEQERPNVFTTSAANIGPGETVAVAIEYQQTLRYDQGEFRLRFPLVVAPRYVPGAVRVAGVAGTGWGVNTDAVPDAARITPPVPRGDGDLNPVSLTVELEPGFPIDRLASSTHVVRAQPREGGYTVALAGGAVAADRDFELTWAPAPDRAPQAAVFTEERDGRRYALLMVMPPADEKSERRLPRDVTFVIDTSGSMHGASLESAKRALAFALDRLHPDDRFNVIQFNSTTRMLFAAPQGADDAHVGAAREYVAALTAQGGTEMASALAAALFHPAEPGRIKQVLFITDGAVGNEAQLFALIRAKLGEARLFTVGIGSAPNGHFMSKAAQMGRGTHTVIGRVAEVEERMAALFAKLEHPVLSDLRVTWPDGAEVLQWPQKIPDLYLGEPVAVSAMLPAAADHVVVSGRRGEQQWGTVLPLAGAQAERGVAALWARHRVAALMDTLHDGADPAQVRAEVIRVALEHRLVSRYTSLVAVDVTPSRPEALASRESAVPVNLPHGWSHDAVFGPAPRTATAAPLHVALGLAALALALALFAVSRTRRPA